MKPRLGSCFGSCSCVEAFGIWSIRGCTTQNKGINEFAACQRTNHLDPRWRDKALQGQRHGGKVCRGQRHRDVGEILHKGNNGAKLPVGCAEPTAQQASSHLTITATHCVAAQIVYHVGVSRVDSDNSGFASRSPHIRGRRSGKWRGEAQTHSVPRRHHQTLYWRMRRIRTSFSTVRGCPGVCTSP